MYPVFVSRNIRLHDNGGRAIRGQKRNTEPGRLSKDGQWRSFPKVPNLIQYVPNGNYYARIKVGGKVIRRSWGPTLSPPPS